jgi:hypothetical protein
MPFVGFQGFTDSEVYLQQNRTFRGSFIEESIQSGSSCS